MNERPYVIVVGLDYESDGDLAFDAAVRTAEAHRQTEIHVVHVERSMPKQPKPKPEEVTGVSPYSTRAETAMDRVENHAQDRLDALQKERPAQALTRVVTHFRLGTPAEQIVQLAIDLDADLILVGTHNRTGLKRLVLGSVAEKVVHMARCPVQVVRPKDHWDLGDVPEIEPPCEQCLERRAETQGAEMWCARHELAKYRPRVHKVIRGGGFSDPEPWSQTSPQT